MTEDSDMLSTMTKNYKVLRCVHNDLYKTVAENFKYYVDNLNQTNLDEIDADIVSSGLNSIKNVQNTRELLMLLDYFYFINGRFPTTNEQTFVPRAKPPLEVNGEELNIKKLYEKFRGTDSHGIVCSQFLAGIFLFFDSGGEEKARNFLSEFYQNMTVSTLSTNHSFQFDAFTELLTTLSLLFRRLASTQADAIKSEDDRTVLQLKTKYEIDDDDPPPPYPYSAVYTTKPGNVSEKIRQFNEDVVEPKLETPTEIKQNNTQRKFDQVWLDNFLNGVKTTKQVLQELNDQAIPDLLSEEVMVPEADTQIDPIFIDDDDIFAKDDLTDENKEFKKHC